MISNKLITDIADFISNSIAAVAIGTGNEPALNDTTLDQEVLRKAGTIYIDDDIVVAEMYIDETELNDINLTNTGIFDSMQLIAGGAIDEIKTNTESLTISLEITVERN